MDSGEPIAYAHIHLLPAGPGAVSNAQGEFRLVTSSGSEARLLRISSVGFKSKEIPVPANGQPVEVMLEEDIIGLNEVIFQGNSGVEAIVRKAIESIPHNYPLKVESVEGFLRTTVSTDSTKTRPYYILEAVLLAEKEPYSRADDEGIVSLKEGRKYEFERADSLRTKFYGGLHTIHWGDLVKARTGPLNLRSVGKYNYFVSDTTLFGSEQILVIDFEGKDGSRVSGKLFISLESYAIPRIILTAKDLETRRLGSWESRALAHYDVHYYRSDSLWRVKAINYKTTFKRADGSNFYLYDDFVASQYFSDIGKISHSQRFDYTSLVIDNLGQYDSLFWQNYNILLPDDATKNAIRTNTLKSEDPSLSVRQKIINLASRMKFSLGLSMVRFQHTGAGVLYTNEAFLLETSTAPGEFSVIPLTYSLNFGLGKYFTVGFSTLSSFRRKEFESIGVEFGGHFPVTRSKRPLFINPSVSLGYSSAGISLGSSPNNEGFSVGGEKFDSDYVKGFLVEQCGNLGTKLSLSYPVGKRTELESGLSYNLNFLNKSSLRIEEDEPFYKRKGAVVPGGNISGAPGEPNPTLTRYKFAMFAGFSYSF